MYFNFQIKTHNHFIRIILFNFYQIIKIYLFNDYIISLNLNIM
jgi:hypothetical protein